MGTRQRQAVNPASGPAGPASCTARSQQAWSGRPQPIAVTLGIVNGRHRGPAQHPAVNVLWVMGVIAFLAWLIFFHTPREDWAGSGLIFLVGSITTIARGRGRGSSRWLAAGQALVAASLFLHAAASQRQWPRAYAVADDSIRAAAAACLVTSIVLMLRSGTLSFRRPSWLSRNSSASS